MQFLRSPLAPLASCSAWSWWHLEVAPASLSHQAIGKEKRRGERRGEERRGGEEKRREDKKERRRKEEREEEGGERCIQPCSRIIITLQFVPQSEGCGPFEGAGQESCLGGKTTSQ